MLIVTTQRASHTEERPLIQETWYAPCGDATMREEAYADADRRLPDLLIAQTLAWGLDPDQTTWHVGPWHTINYASDTTRAWRTVEADDAA